MKYHAVVAVAASLLSVASARPHLEHRQTPSKACSHLTGGVHVIAAPGEGFADPPYGLIGSLAASILKAIPGSTNVSVPYNHSETNGLMQTKSIEATMNTYIAQYHKACPNTKIVLLGYSSGGVGTMNAICGESAAYPNPVGPLSTATYNKTVIAAIIYGDESRTKGDSYDKGTCTGVGIHPRPNAAGCSAWASKIQSYCTSTDPLCCATTGTNQTTHYDYPALYDKTATNFVVKQLKLAGGA